MIIFFIPFLIAYILILWFETDFYVEYAKLFGIQKWSKSLAKFLESGSHANYKECLIKEYGTFFTKLITCPICFGTWLNIITTAILFIINAFFHTKIPVVLFILISPYLSLFLYTLYTKVARH